MPANLGGTQVATTLAATDTIFGNEGGDSAKDRVFTGAVIKASMLGGINAISGPGTVVAVTVPSITDPDCAKVDVSVSALAFQPVVGDFVIAAPAEALPTNCRLGAAWVSATDQVTITFHSEGGNVVGAAKNFTFLFFDQT